jgi:hypothetical protein
MSDRYAFWWRVIVVTASTAAFVGCLAQTAFVTECCYVVGDTRSVPGLVLLFTGWMGVLSLSSNAGYAAWFANPMIVAVWFLYLGGKRLAALIFAALALGLTLTFLRVAEVPLSDKLTPVEVIAYGTGYWLWIVSAGILVAGLSADMLLFRLFRYIHARLSAIPIDF